MPWERETYLVERADALLSGVGLEVAEDHLLDEQPRPCRPTRRPRRRLRRGGLHDHLAVQKCSSERGSRAPPAAAGRRRGPRSPAQLSAPAQRSAALPRRARRRNRGGEEEGTAGAVRGKLKWLRGGADSDIWGKFGRGIETVREFRVIPFRPRRLGPSRCGIQRCQSVRPK